MSAKKILINYVAIDELEKVLQGLFFLAKKYGDERLLHSTTMQSGRLKALGLEKRNGILSHAEEALQSAKIRDALLHIINDLPDDWTMAGMENESVPSSSVSNTKWKKYAAYIAGVVAVLAGVAEMSGYNLRDIFKNNQKTEIPLKPSQPKQSATTSGDKSPAVITNDGDVNISYGETQLPKDTTKKQNPTQR